MQILKRATLGSLESGFVVDEVMYARLTAKMSEVLEKSIVEFPVYGSLEIALRERFQKLEAWCLILRHDFKWSVPRIIDHLEMALRKELLGQKFDPTSLNKDGMWVGRKQ